MADPLFRFVQLGWIRQDDFAHPTVHPAEHWFSCVNSVLDLVFPLLIKDGGSTGSNSSLAFVGCLSTGSVLTLQFHNTLFIPFS